MFGLVVQWTVTVGVFDYCALGCGFVVFKQKTAYEMRISDWSSDVCSSDLVQFDELASANVIYATKAKPFQRMVDGLSLWVQDAAFQFHENAGFHIGRFPEMSRSRLYLKSIRLNPSH